jgi:hypothetical protein
MYINTSNFWVIFFFITPGGGIYLLRQLPRRHFTNLRDHRSHMYNHIRSFSCFNSVINNDLCGNLYSKDSCSLPLNRVNNEIRYFQHCCHKFGCRVSICNLGLITLTYHSIRNHSILKFGGGAISRHNIVCDTLASLCRQRWIEEKDLLPDTDRRPADVFVVLNWALDKSVCIDVAVVYGRETNAIKSKE